MTSQDRRDETTDRDQLEMSRLLNSRRVETHEGPFRGFQSPPGRF